MSEETVYRQTPCFPLYAPHKVEKTESVKKSPVCLKKQFIDRLRVFHFMPPCMKWKRPSLLKITGMSKKHFIDRLRTPSFPSTMHVMGVGRIPYTNVTILSYINI